jgi:FkbM family methyltransferase
MIDPMTQARGPAGLLSIAVRMAGWLPPGLGARVAGSTRLRAALRGLINRIAPVDEAVRVRVVAGGAKGALLELNLREEKAFWAGMFEPVVEGVFADIVRPGSVVYDIGAHIGYYTLIAARRTGAGGQVVAFEPDPQNRARLERHIALNELVNTRVVPFAVSDASGTARLQQGLGAAMSRLADEGADAAGHVHDIGQASELPDARLAELCASELRLLQAELILFRTRGVDPGDLPAQISTAGAAVGRQDWPKAWNLIRAGRQSARSRLAVLHHMVEVRTVTLDEFVYGAGNPAPDVIKIDVEGAEARLIVGATRVIEQAAPMILCELHGIDPGRRILEFLMERGYEIRAVENGLDLVTQTVIAVGPGGTHILAKPARHGARYARSSEAAGA